MAEGERFMGAFSMVPVVRDLCGCDAHARKLIWRLYFENWEKYTGTLEEKSVMLRQTLEQHLGVVVPKDVEIGFWRDKRDKINELLAELPKAR